MFRKSLFPLFLVLLALAPAAFPAAEEAPKITGTLVEKGGVPVLTVWGSPYDRGFAQGYLMAAKIVSGSSGGFALVESMAPGAYASRIMPLAGMGFRFSPAEEEELKGILEGIDARLPEEERVVPSIGRALTLLDLKAINTFGDWYSLGCSSAAVWGTKTEDGTPSVVRNFDFPPLEMITKGQHVRVVVPGPAEKGVKGWVGVCHPGSVGAITALSEDGVFAAVHDVNLKPAQKDLLQANVPRLLAIKRIVAEIEAKGAVETAVERCRSWNTLYGNNFMVATREPGDGVPAGVLEYDTLEDKERGVTLRGPDLDAEDHALPFVVCSNHHRIRDSGRCGRYQALYDASAARKGVFDVDALFDLAGLSAVPRDGSPVSANGMGTLHQTVALTGARVLYVKLGDIGRHIRDAKAVKFDVRASLEAARTLAEAE